MSLYYCKRCSELTYPVEDCKFCKMGRGETMSNQAAKSLDITDVKDAHKTIGDLKVFGDGDTWVLLCKASSESQGWMKSTKVMNVTGGCIVQVTTQQRSDGINTTYAVAEALTYVPGVCIADGEPRRLIALSLHAGSEVVRTSALHSSATRSDHRR